MEPITITLSRRQRIARKYSGPCRVASYVPGGHGRYHKEKSNRVSLYRSSRPRLESSQSGHHQCAYGCEAACCKELSNQLNPRGFQKSIAVHLMTFSQRRDLPDSARLTYQRAERIRRLSFCFKFGVA
jgi:hypothetical protein